MISSALTQSVTLLGGIIQRWAERGVDFERFGVQVDGARLCAEVVSDLRQIESAEAQRMVGLEEAAQLSGFSADHIGRLVREGRIMNYGRKGAPLVRVVDLPRKPGSLTSATPLAILAPADRRRIARSLLASPKGETRNAS